MSSITVIPFTKMHGLGNDYLFLDAFRDPTLAVRNDLDQLAVAMSNRRRGAGADGVVLLAPDADADAAMSIWNADGSDGVICGNGLRCAARLLRDRGHVPAARMRIRTGAGLRTAEVRRDGPVLVEVDMGEPTVDPTALPLRLEALDRIEDGAEFAVGGRQGLFIGVGNPHFIVLDDNLDAIDLPGEGGALERHDAFPERMNIQFTSIESRGRLRVRSWERGSGATDACGTGACAAAVGVHLLGLADRCVTVGLPGGDLNIRWDEASGHVFQRGPATYAYEGQWPSGA